MSASSTRTPLRHTWILWVGGVLIGLYALSQIQVKQHHDSRERLLSALSWRGIASFPLQGEAHPGHAPAID